MTVLWKIGCSIKLALLVTLLKRIRLERYPSIKFALDSPLNTQRHSELSGDFSPDADEQLAQLYRLIAEAASPNVALRYVGAVVDYCESLSKFPHRGVPCADIRPGLRMTYYKKRALIAFRVDPGLVSIIGVFYGGQDFETILRDDADD